MITRGEWPAASAWPDTKMQRGPSNGAHDNTSVTRQPVRYASDDFYARIESAKGFAQRLRSEAQSGIPIRGFQPFELALSYLASEVDTWRAEAERWTPSSALAVALRSGAKSIEAEIRSLRNAIRNPQPERLRAIRHVA